MTYEKLKTKTILIVEDEDVVRSNLSSMLSCFFKEVYSAKDGYEGLEKYEKHLPEIIITDFKMPNLNGLEMIQELSKKNFSPYTIMISAHTDTDLLIDAIHNKIDRYIIKPICEKALFDSFNAYIKHLKNEESIIILSENKNYDSENNIVIIKNSTLHLNKKENLLLKLLTKDFYKTFTYEEIEYNVWGNETMSIIALRSVIRDLRKKIGQEFIKNVSGVGYRLLEL